MLDPLREFDWESLVVRYEEKCSRSGRFEPNAPPLDCFADRPSSDRALYHLLVDRVRSERLSSGQLSLPTYEAIVYWKMYSTCINANNEVRKNPARRAGLTRRLASVREFPASAQEDRRLALGLVARMLALRLYGMRLPVCTTVLHFMYPQVVPIFDQMVLRAVGYSRDEIKARELNQSSELYGQYLEHHWSLVRTYSPKFARLGLPETPVRAVEMALWVNRGEG